MFRYTLSIILLLSTILICDTSGFSILSIGDVETSLSNVTGVAASDSLVLKNHNFSSWAGVSNTSFGLSVSYTAHELENSAGNTSNFDRFMFDEINFALPFGNKHFFGIAYYPVGISDITNVSNNEVEVEESFENTYLKTLENKIGSISNISFIYGKEFGPLSFNVNSSFKLGNYDISRRYQYTSYVDSADTDVIDWEKFFEAKEKTQLFHFALGSGFLYKTPIGLDIGGTFSIPLASYGRKISELDRTTIYGTVNEEIENIEEDIDDIEWPFEFSAGLSYQYSEINFSYDFSYKAFDGLNVGLQDTEMTDYVRNIFGVSYHPGKRKFDPYYERIKYSAFFGIEKRPYEFNDESIVDLSTTLAFNFPLNNNFTDIEMRLGYIKSGSIEDNEMENSTYKLQFIFHSSDRWWLKKEKYTD